MFLGSTAVNAGRSCSTTTNIRRLRGLQAGVHSSEGPAVRGLPRGACVGIRGPEIGGGCRRQGGRGVRRPEWLSRSDRPVQEGFTRTREQRAAGSKERRPPDARTWPSPPALRRPPRRRGTPISSSDRSLFAPVGFDFDAQIQEDLRLEECLQVLPRFGPNPLDHLAAAADDDRLLRLVFHQDGAVHPQNPFRDRVSSN